jgi:hypothetical protein
MKKAAIFTLFFLSVILYQIFLPPPAHAYIDLGSGSYVVEIIIATMVTGIFVLKQYWRRIREFFLKKKNGENKH